LLASYDDLYDKQVDKLRTSLDSGIISQSAYNDQAAALDAALASGRTAALDGMQSNYDQYLNDTTGKTTANHDTLKNSAAGYHAAQQGSEIAHGGKMVGIAVDSGQKFTAAQTKDVGAFNATFAQSKQAQLDILVGNYGSMGDADTLYQQFRNSMYELDTDNFGRYMRNLGRSADTGAATIQTAFDPVNGAIVSVFQGTANQVSGITNSMANNVGGAANYIISSFRSIQSEAKQAERVAVASANAAANAASNAAANARAANNSQQQTDTPPSDSSTPRGARTVARSVATSQASSGPTRYATTPAAYEPVNYAAFDGEIDLNADNFFNEYNDFLDKYADLNGITISAMTRTNNSMSTHSEAITASLTRHNDDFINTVDAYNSDLEAENSDFIDLYSSTIAAENNNFLSAFKKHTQTTEAALGSHADDLERSLTNASNSIADSADKIIASVNGFSIPVVTYPPAPDYGSGGEGGYSYQPPADGGGQSQQQQSMAEVFNGYVNADNRQTIEDFSIFDAYVKKWEHFDGYYSTLDAYDNNSNIVSITGGQEITKYSGYAGNERKSTVDGATYNVLNDNGSGILTDLKGGNGVLTVLENGLVKITESIMTRDGFGNVDKYEQKTRDLGRLDYRTDTDWLKDSGASDLLIDQIKAYQAAVFAKLLEEGGQAGYAQQPTYYHSGGIAGIDKSNREIDATILKGEGVFTQAQMAAMAPISSMQGNQRGGSNVVVNVHEATNTQTEVRQTEQPDGSIQIDVIARAVEGKIMQRMRAGGGMAKQLQGQYGLRRGS